MDIKRTTFSLYLFFIFSFFRVDFCLAKGIILPTQLLKDSESITSSGHIFRLGFFSPGNSTNRYVGIWYNTVPGKKVIVWVANRDHPLTDNSGVLRINGNGNLAVLDGNQNVVWTTNVSVATNSSMAELWDSGNLVLREIYSSGNNISDTGRIIWQSFEQPTDTLLKDMKLGSNTKTGDKQVITSWKTDSDPSKGRFFFELEPLNIPQIVLWSGTQRHWRSGPWDGRVFIGIETMISKYGTRYNLLQDDQGGSVFSFSIDLTFYRIFLEPKGRLLEYYVADIEQNIWFLDWIMPKTNCHYYGYCGPFGFCNIKSSPVCSCLRGYEPKSTDQWSIGNWSSGCIRRRQLHCEGNDTNGEKGTQDKFWRYQRMKVPDFANLVLVDDLGQCEQSCLLNCSCTAYSHVSGIGCMMWHGTLLDMEMFSTDGADLYIRVGYTELDKKNMKVIITLTVLAGLLIVAVCMYICWRRVDKHTVSEEVKEPDLPMFKYEELSVATSNFFIANKLGEGGFGSVYKGKLPDGEEIAVKRLSKNSGQGTEEFKNEVAVISGLQHRNLVKLIGFCIEGEEKMLIYEYMPNKSLDAFLFDPKRKEILGWRKCFEIIEGIGRGILYLHRDSRLKVIHRDLKPSNILLDKDLNPKISDFGMARIVGGDELQANTRRVVGTYGYMSPEYAMDGLFSEKSDVYSFGVLMLEIITGMRNTGFYHHEESYSLIEHVWKSWNIDKTQEIIDLAILEPFFEEQILRCIHIGLLCVQEYAKDRPTMSTIVLMLSSEITTLSTPEKPAFTGRQAHNRKAVKIRKLGVVMFASSHHVGNLVRTKLKNKLAGSLQSDGVGLGVELDVLWLRVAGCGMCSRLQAERRVAAEVTGLVSGTAVCGNFFVL